MFNKELPLGEKGPLNSPGAHGAFTLPGSPQSSCGGFLGLTIALGKGKAQPLLLPWVLVNPLQDKPQISTQLPCTFTHSQTHKFTLTVTLTFIQTPIHSPTFTHTLHDSHICTHKPHTVSHTAISHRLTRPSSQTYTHSHMLTDSHTLVSTSTDSPTHTLSSHTPSHRLIPTHRLTQPHTHKPIHTHTFMQTCPASHMNSHSQAHTFTHLYTHLYTLTLMHTHTASPCSYFIHPSTHSEPLTYQPTNNLDSSQWGEGACTFLDPKRDFWNLPW